MKNEGYVNELELIKLIDGKTFKDLNEEMKRLMLKMNLIVVDERKFFASKYDFHAKPDIVIEYGDQIRFISLKIGNSKYVHSEGIKTLIEFLREMNISLFTQKVIVMCHYGDGTLNGTGKQRYSFEEILNILQREIKNANKELNNPKTIRKVIERFVFDGPGITGVKSVDYLVYKSDNRYYCASKKELLEYVLNRNYNYIKTIHIGPITLRPYVRNVKTKKDEYKRQISQADWASLKSSIMQIDKKSSL